MSETGWKVLERLRPLCNEAAARHGVVPEIHPEDFIFRFLLGNPAFENERAAVSYYFDDGARSAEKLASLLAELRGSPDEGLELLEFASGYGCVTRHLRRALPGDSITNCDIHEGAVSFVQDKIGMRSILSDSVPESLRTPISYDVVFALSFFSHMPRATWGRWLMALLARLKPGGHLIFTTHGNESLKFFGFPEIPADGFWFRSLSEQDDLDREEYGTTFTTPLFVFQLMHEQQTEARIVCFREAYWWTHQDLYIYRNIPNIS